MEKQSKKTYKIFMFGFFIGVIGFATSFFMYLSLPNPIQIYYDMGDKETVMPSGIIFKSISDSIYLEDAIPTLDKFGVLEEGFFFSIKNINLKNLDYELKLIDDNSTIMNNNIRYQLIKNDEIIGIYTLSEDGLLEKASIKENEEIHYTIKLWLDYDSEVKIGRFSKRIGIQEILDDTIEEASKPVLTKGMIPVYYNNDTNSWYKTDESNTNNKWYSYSEAKWANVITVNSDKRSFYENSSTGTKIDSNDINSMWVWIPRFNYELNNTDINITFVNDSEKAYPAFTFNKKELTGFWFSKFEGAFKSDSECISSSLTNKCNNSNNELYFVPNYPFATKITMANLFYSIRKMELKNNIYGFNGTGTKVNNDGTIKGDKNDLDIHMIKNTEWQAVALLSDSKYGKAGNNIYDDNSKKIINNNSLFTGRGYVGNEEYEYNVSLKGEAASTTGNIYGVYDMAGGKREYVMINNKDLNIFNKKSNSGFTTKVKEYYYDNDFTDIDTTIKLKDKYNNDNLIGKEPLTRGGYKNTGNIFNIYGTSDYIDKVSIETNSRACLTIIKGEE